MSLVNFLMMMGNVPRTAAAPLAPAISGLTATRVSEGTGCGSGLGVRFTVEWTPNASVTNADHDVKITLSNVGGTVTATRVQAATIPTIDITSNENQTEGGGNFGTYICTFELIATAGPTTIQSGAVPGNPDSSIYDIETGCTI